MRHLKFILLASAFLVSTCLVYAFEDAELSAMGEEYDASIKQEHNPKGAASRLTQTTSKAKGDLHMASGAWEKAAAEYERAIAYGANTPAIWLALSKALSNHKDVKKAYAAAYMAYKAAKSSADKAQALFQLGSLYESESKPQLAIKAYEEGLSLRRDPNVAKRYESLVGRYSFSLKDVSVDSESEPPRVCLAFSDELHSGKKANYGDYIRLQPEASVTLSVHENNLCIEGLDYGISYKLTVLVGLPSAFGEKTVRPVEHSFKTDDRRKSIGFRGGAYILPKIGSQGLPLITVNVDKVKMKVLRITDRNLINEINRRRIASNFGGYQIEEVENVSGELLWEGEMEVDSVRNAQITTSFPISEVLANPKPGIHVVIAEQIDDEAEYYEVKATQWVVVSDLGLSTLRGIDGLYAFVRSLDTAKPVQGVELILYGRNNDELGKAITDASGMAKFSPGLFRATGGATPAAIMAKTSDGDFNFLDLTRPGFDLSDRGVGGRKAPGPIDVFIYTDRGVYRPGETVNLVALMRDDKARAIKDMPLTFKVIRPDGVEDRRVSLRSHQLGGYHLSLPLADSARTGSWIVTAHVDPRGESVGRAEFRVEDYVPERMELALGADGKVLKPGVRMTINAIGRYLYGAPAAEKKMEAEFVLRVDGDPYPMHPGYRFGLVQEEWTPERFSVEVGATDEEGKASFDVSIGDDIDTTLPLQAVVYASIFETGGRPTNNSLTVPVRARPFAIGLRPRFGGSGVEEGKAAEFDVIAVNDEGALVAARELKYEFYEEDYYYQWFHQNNTWDYRVIIREKLLTGGKLSLSDQGPALLSKNVEWGRYRLEVYDPTTGAATSVRFWFGWFISPTIGDTPDKLEITMDKPSYKPGEEARIYLRPPFDGEVLMAVLSNRIHETKAFSAFAEGTTVNLPISEEWGSGTYVMVVSFRPGRVAGERGPGRAIGLAWISLDQSERILKVKMDLPEEVRPRQTANLPVQVTGLGIEGEAYLTVSAVDEGILQLTSFKTPDPGGYFYGKRQLDVTILDAYGRLIDGKAGQVGRIRSGGDGEEMEESAEARHSRGLETKAIKSVALFSGIVRLDAEGRALIPLELPDFNGRLRLMAAAYDSLRVGMGEGRLIVRDALVSLASMPRFLAPEDESEFTLELHNVSAPPGDYRIVMTSGGGVLLSGETDKTVHLQPDKRHVAKFALRGVEVGSGWIAMDVTGPDGFTLGRKWEIGIRPAQSITTTRQMVSFRPGSNLTYNTRLLSDYLSGTGEVALSFSSVPNMDVPGLLRELDKYPYGCLEQTTSRALPLLYYNEVARASLSGIPTDDALKGRIQDAIRRVLNMQRSDGSFALWDPYGNREEWLTAYVMDFLTRAKKEGYLVFDYQYDRGIEWLSRSVESASFRPSELYSRAYAFYVLAQVGVANIGALRYFHDNYLSSIPTPLATAQLGAALALSGDASRATAAFTRARANLKRAGSHRDYGSTLRDLAGLVSLMAEAGVGDQELLRLAEELSTQQARTKYTSTQEKVWLLLAANALLKGSGDLNISVNNQQITGLKKPFNLLPVRADLEKGIAIRNTGRSNLWHIATVSGIPKADQPAKAEGFKISRSFYRMDGGEVDLSKVKQSDMLVVVIQGEATTGLDHQALIVDLLPAGFEIENTRLDNSRSIEDLSWLPEVSETLHIELRDDRFLAALDLGRSNKAFTVAYLVRAITPGTYRLPAVFVEDMYKAEYRAQSGMGQVKVLGWE